jgi:hypothetical protein
MDLSLKNRKDNHPGARCSHKILQINAKRLFKPF